MACLVVQRLRDQVRDWVDSGQKHLDMDMLLEARRDVEVEMVSPQLSSSRINKASSAVASSGTL